MTSSTFRFRAFAALIAAGAALAGCARSPEEIAAQDEKMRAEATRQYTLLNDNPQLALTPRMRFGIAQMVAKTVQGKLFWDLNTYEDSTISQLKSQFKGDKANMPYYCVDVAYKQPLNFFTGHQFFRVTPTATANGYHFELQSSMTVAGANRTDGCGEEADSKAPFPEVLGLLAGHAPVAAAAVPSEPQPLTHEPNMNATPTAPAFGEYRREKLGPG